MEGVRGWEPEQTLGLPKSLALIKKTKAEREEI